jgi:dolichol-phosphate mannosyltransferase
LNIQNSNKVLIIVPTYNEGPNIETLLDQIFAQDDALNVLFVDDNSKDETQFLISRYAEKKPGKIHLLPRKSKLGLGTAYIAGFKWALARDFDIICEMDADLSHDPKYLKTILNLHVSHDVVVGSRYIFGGGTKNWGIFRRLVSRFGSLYARTILGIPVQDLTGGFNSWRRQVLESMDLDMVKSEGYSFQIELKFRAYRGGFLMIESPIVFVDRVAGDSKMSFGIVLEKSQNKEVRRSWRGAPLMVRSVHGLYSRIGIFAFSLKQPIALRTIPSLSCQNKCAEHLDCHCLRSDSGGCTSLRLMRQN